MAVNKKAIFVVVFFGGILLTSTILFALPPPNPTMSEGESEMEITRTGTPMDNFPDEQRDTFCGVEDAQSNSYVTEYMIPTVCTQPLAIKVTPDGNVWFVESNAGRIVKFNPQSEKFIEFENPMWPEQARTMSWGIDYSPDGSLWYTDGVFDTIWKFNTFDETYTPLSYPQADSGSLPQKLEIDGSNIFVNDFTGGKITIFDLVQNIDEIQYTSILNPIPEAFTGDFAIDSENHLWYTNWVPETTGFLVKFNFEKYKQETLIQLESGNATPLEDYIQVFEFPNDLNTANGLAIDSGDNVWIVDTSSSFFFKFNPSTEKFTKYITTIPDISTYGNTTGVIKSPISRPYWVTIDSQDNIVFNEQTGNQIGVFDHKNDLLVEYMIPSKNPNWADCDLSSKTNCGVSQVFGFDVTDNQIWFTEWAENKIGVIDTAKELPFSLEFDKQKFSIKKGYNDTVKLTITYPEITNWSNIKIKSSHTASSTVNFSDLEITSSSNQLESETQEIIFTIHASQTSLSGNYKVLLGVADDDVTISKYIDVTIES